MAKRRLSAREVKEGRAAEILKSMRRNMALCGSAHRAAQEDMKLLEKLFAELTEKEGPPCSDSGPSSPSSG